MIAIGRLLGETKRIYDRGGSPVDEIGATVTECLTMLHAEATARFLVTLHSKDYWVAAGGTRLSRPFLPTLHIADAALFTTDWNALLGAMNSGKHRIDLDADIVNKVLYTAINAFSLCYDLWKPGSRKTPGTFLEVLFGTVIGRLLPRHWTAPQKLVQVV